MHISSNSRISHPVFPRDVVIAESDRGPVTRRRRVHELEQRARELFEQQPHFRGRGSWVRCRCAEDQLLLEGEVPTFYLKQLAQEVVKGMPDAPRVENRIVVANPRGELFGSDSLHP